MTRRPVVLLALLALTAPAFAPGHLPEAAAQGASAPWWDVADKTRPTAGWGYRVPVLVENTLGHDVKNAPVSVSLDLSPLLVFAGWTNQTVGQERRARGFTLDVDSIRVVEYLPGFRGTTGDAKPVPHVFHPSLLTEPMKGREFDASRNPAGSVTWTVPQLPDKERRYYYVYFSSLEYGDRGPATHKDVERAVVDGLHWGGPGNVFYGFENGADGRENRLLILGLHDDTNVSLYTYAFGVPRLHSPDGGNRNPTTVNKSELEPYSLPQRSFFKIVADKPVVLASHGQYYRPRAADERPSYGSGGFIPSLDGGFRGNRFWVPHLSNELYLFASEFAPSTLREVPSGNPVATLSGATPYVRISLGEVPQTGSTSLFSYTVTGPPIMMAYGGVGTTSHQAPSRAGAPFGKEFLVYTPRTGGIGLLGLGTASVRVFDPKAGDSKQVIPQGTNPISAPLLLQPGFENHQFFDGNDTFPNSALKVLSTSEPQYVPPGGPGDIVVFAGGPTRVGGGPIHVGSYGGEAAAKFAAFGPAGVLAYYNETRVRVTSHLLDGGTTNFTFTLNEDGLFLLPAAQGDAIGRYDVVANKPIVVASAESANVYGRFVHGRLTPPKVTVGALEFRGPLVDLESAERPGRQVFKSTGPGQPVEFTLNAKNLGRWIGGEGLPDSVIVSCADTLGWKLEGCDTTLRLGAGSVQTFSVKATPPADAKPGVERDTITVTATSASARNVTSSVALFVRVEVTYGVGLWIGGEGGPKKQDPPINLDPGKEHVYDIVLKNLGSVADVFELRHQDPAQGWEVELLRDGKKIRDVSLGPGDRAGLKLRVKAPAEPTVSFNLVEVVARSLGSPLQADKVETQTRIRPDVRFAMRLDESTKLARPGETARFNVSVENRGNDVFDVAFRDPEGAPQAWTARLRLVGDSLLLFPGQSGNLSLEVTPPAAALEGELATVKLEAEPRITGGEKGGLQGETITAAVVVRQVHNLSIPEFDEIRAAPGRGVEFTLAITNLGNGDEEVELLSSSVRPFWPLQAPGGVSVPRGAEVDMPLVLTAPGGTPAGTYTLNFSLRLDREAVHNVSVPLRIETIRALEVDAGGRLRLSPGQEYAFPLDVRNAGNVNSSYTLAVEGPPGWKGRVVPSFVDLPYGSGRTVTLHLNATREALDGPAEVRLVRTTGDERAETLLGVDVARPDLVVAIPAPPPAARRGDLLVVTASVANRGRIDAMDVRVGLFVNGDPVDLVTLSRVPVGRSSPVTLTWSVDRDVDALEVRVNPDATIVEAATDEGQVARVQFATTRLPAPGLAMVLLGVAGVAVAAGVRRRG